MQMRSYDLAQAILIAAEFREDGYAAAYGHSNSLLESCTRGVYQADLSPEWIFIVQVLLTHNWFNAIEWANQIVRTIEENDTKEWQQTLNLLTEENPNAGFKSCEEFKAFFSVFQAK